MHSKSPPQRSHDHINRGLLSVIHLFIMSAVLSLSVSVPHATFSCSSLRTFLTLLLFSRSFVPLPLCPSLMASLVRLIFTEFLPASCPDPHKWTKIKICRVFCFLSRKERWSQGEGYPEQWRPKVSLARRLLEPSRALRSFTPSSFPTCAVQCADEETVLILYFC